MMRSKTFNLEFLTPCFAAGADQTRAEMRASEVRGQLRWWFRALGGGPDEERDAFGGVQGDEPAASNLVVRCRAISATGEKDWFSDQKIPRQGLDHRTYLLGFFCGRTGRLQASGALPPGSKATVTLTYHRPPTEQLEKAVQIFFSVGALGFRSSRCAGAFATAEYALTSSTWSALSGDLQRSGFKVVILPDHFSNWVELCDRAGWLLKDKLRGGTGLSAGRNGTSANALGSAKPRQASVVHLRPVRVDQRLRLAILEAPHARILGPEATRAHGTRGAVLRLAGLMH